MAAPCALAAAGRPRRAARWEPAWWSGRPSAPPPSPRAAPRPRPSPRRPVALSRDRAPARRARVESSYTDRPDTAPYNDEKSDLKIDAWERADKQCRGNCHRKKVGPALRVAKLRGCEPIAHREQCLKYGANRLARDKCLGTDLSKSEWWREIPLQ